MKGWVYVINNLGMPDIVKVGYTTGTPEDRAKELNNTGAPHRYMVEYAMESEEPYQIEQQTHRLLSSKLEGREWFRCSAEEAAAAIKQVAGSRVITEIYPGADRAKAEALYQQEQARREREKAKQDFEGQVRNEVATIREKTKRKWAAENPPEPFLTYWGGGAGIIVIALFFFDANISFGAGFMLSVIGGGIVGFFLREYFDKGEEELASDLVREMQRDEELAAVRAREQLQPSKQAAPPIDEKLFAELQKQAESGDFRAQGKLALMYRKGEGVPQDDQEAVKWWRRAADQEHAAEQGHASVLSVLGAIYHHGESVPQDYAEAWKWYRFSAEQGWAAAKHALGCMCYKGEGVSQDYAEAMKWFRLAADQGYAEAQFNLGVMYDNGQGVPQDYPEAAKWYRLAAEQGIATAKKSIETLETKMTPQQIAEAQQLAREWKAK